MVGLGLWLSPQTFLVWLGSSGLLQWVGEMAAWCTAPQHILCGPGICSAKTAQCQQEARLWGVDGAVESVSCLAWPQL